MGSHQDFAATRQNLGFWDTDGSTSSETPQDQSLGQSCRWLFMSTHNKGLAAQAFGGREPSLTDAALRTKVCKSTAY
ncbi:hypothetical protein PhaeoP30_03704 (plasmid) [Phaeobacter inhibens]|uniref:hypothetical protein n=1 Tax=Phaeobacter inhibens TaxID=221822 RepID=UPI000CA2A9AE|nr:hypothetical protein [Phaeobacter inhibens]AUQ60563.1 hypothetical protein PhaeoP30_03704 [Phaeobacter inhibens]UWR82247.1 hypothetical protein K4K97_17735 [Phaeobacter inhibens]